MIQLRPPLPEDCYIVWEWANDPDTRRASFTSGKITREQHAKWYAAILRDENCLSYIITNEAVEVPIGYIRFHFHACEAAASINIAPAHRDQGYGTEAISVATHRIFEETLVARIQAFIKPDNIQSICAFGKAGYRMSGKVLVRGIPAYLFEIDRPAVT